MEHSTIMATKDNSTWRKWRNHWAPTISMIETSPTDCIASDSKMEVEVEVQTLNLPRVRILETSHINDNNLPKELHPISRTNLTPIRCCPMKSNRIGLMLSPS